MKRSELFFGALLVPIDFIALLSAAASAYFLRLSNVAQGLRPAVFAFDLPFAEYMQLASIVSFVIIFVFSLHGLYAMRVTRRALDEVTQIFSGISIGIMIIILYIFLRAELFQSRFIIITAYVLAFLFVSFGRMLVRQMQHALLRRGMGVHRVVLAGNGPFALELDSIFKRRLDLGYEVVGKADAISWDALQNIYNQYGIDEIIQTNPSLSDADNLILLDFSEQYKIDYRYVPNIFETHAINVRYRQIGIVPLLELSRTPLDGWGRIVKRVIDIGGALFGVVLLSPLLLITVYSIKRNSTGLVIYRQIRAGRNMIPFEIMKFRSMYSEFCVGPRYGGKQAEEKYKELKQNGNERTGPLFKMKKDPRVTSVGRVIRRLRIDELPQLFNVLRGEMSLVGPRPHLLEEIAQYDKYHRKLFAIKPGMSGMAQVAGNAGLSFEEEAKLDIAYIENWSLWLDIVIILKTIGILFRDKNAV
ncbi:MAG TPA: sugar transferase [Candidatus Andersenbacteria bacterium]|nr:sugar transferase [Candidatus Andersenbacteria bacterium]